MSISAPRRSTSALDAVRQVLSRPLASYQIVLGLTAILLGLGLIMVLSASSVYALRLFDNSFYVVSRQAVFAVLGVIGFVAVLRLPWNVLRALVRPALLGTVVLIGLTFTPLGVEINGNRNWLPLFAGISVQPSELAKLALVLWIADLYARRYKYLGTPRYILTPMVPIAGAVAALVVAQKDLGTALVLFAVIVGMLWVAGLPGRHMWFMVLALGVVLIFFVATAPHRITRLLSFLDPTADPEGAGHQSIKAMMAFARGGFWGVGLGGSRQKWGALPEAHNDFILAVIGEELGLAGTLVLLSLFGMLGFVGFRIAMRSRDRFARYAAAGITIWLLAQAIINVGMVLGLLPVIGIPLPLISYGGSSLLATLLGMAFLAKCATTEPGAAQALAASRRQRRRSSKK
ncbi:putative lipid II flippase FtsW [Aeromicrobium phragmitis]|uniref:Probable peptidoglycan glycosyltransferase FtsW n=1 Tax=Aeromicrobium phragmitis TaxID=2478914 RepID=A0A3L8PL01_9ACTN|nr:putative lipid II flippase FtsW [Aeromicrobium phragmitis]RLV55920.1 putative lipid II flippase FtsW [Aeromicrobium phragmitis]